MLELDVVRNTVADVSKQAPMSAYVMRSYQNAVAEISKDYYH